MNPMQMNPFQIIQMLKSTKANPMKLMQQFFGNNPQYQRAMKMAEGKSSEQLQQIAQNLCEQRGINFDQALSQMNSMGIYMPMGKKHPENNK